MVRPQVLTDRNTLAIPMQFIINPVFTYRIKQDQSATQVLSGPRVPAFWAPLIPRQSNPSVIGAEGIPGKESAQVGSLHGVGK